jgi:hypothetical protein
VLVSPARRGKLPYTVGVQGSAPFVNVSKEYRGRREAVRASNMNEPDTIIAPRPSESKLRYDDEKTLTLLG